MYHWYVCIHDVFPDMHDVFLCCISIKVSTFNMFLIKCAWAEVLLFNIYTLKTNHCLFFRKSSTLSRCNSMTVYLKKCANGESWFVVVWYGLILPISSRVASLALGQSYDCPSAREATLKDMGNWMTWNNYELIIKPPHQNKASKPCA